jgi:hypothetical protein
VVVPCRLPKIPIVQQDFFTVFDISQSNEQSQRPTPKHINQKEGEQERDPAKCFEHGTGYGFAVARYDLVAQHPAPKTTTKRIQQIWNVPFETDYGQGKVLVKIPSFCEHITTQR